MAKSALAKRYGKRGMSPGRARVQTLLFPRDWAVQDAILWAAMHGYKTSDVDKTASYVRVHQTRAKGKAEHVKTIPFGTGGMRAVVEWR